MALTCLYYVVGGITLFFLSPTSLIIAVYRSPKSSTLPLLPQNILPLPLDILFIPMLCYTHSEK